MIRNPPGLRLDPDRSVRDQIHEAARLGAKAVVLDAIGDLAPPRLGASGRREARHILRTASELRDPSRKRNNKTDASG